MQSYVTGPQKHNHLGIRDVHKTPCTHGAPLQWWAGVPTYGTLLHEASEELMGKVFIDDFDTFVISSTAVKVWPFVRILRTPRTSSSRGTN